ncbi:MAG TPA: RsiV family protein [Candidatus Paenalcaligenes intestinipullorum]|uniref:RsiV family protein n=1 Tax=Candidatus Paenalcaligenes intestinipullorum TaxID=2838718 RepID=A0A9D2U9E2_9BURK|nr:RsiV family protein [Candidatus Paenalcaligenes intestinipullorum]
MMAFCLRYSSRLAAYGWVGLTVALLGGCASTATPPSKVPPYTDQITQQDGAFSQPDRWQHTQPNCRGNCAKISLDSLVFPGKPELTQYVQQRLLSVALGPDPDQALSPAKNYDQLQQRFWQQAGPRDELMLTAKLRYRNRDLTTLELGLYQYFTGAAHGQAVTELVTWDHAKNQPLSLNDVVRPQRYEDYVTALRTAHQRWLITQEAYQDQPQQYSKMWPFQVSENVGLTDAGLLVKYNSYEIAPYAFGQPELLIPYSDLQGILRHEYLPN